MAAFSPTENDLKEALIALKVENPSLGISKVHALLLSTHRTWQVSEKRTRKILQNEGLVLSSAASKGGSNDSGKLYPSSKLIDDLDSAQWSSKVEVVYFDKRKGKGLIAKEKIAEGEIVWKEDPFLLAPEW